MSDSNSVSPSSEFKPKPCFSHLPWFLKQRIVDKTDIITRFTTRKVCKELRSHVDRSSFHFKRIFFEILRTRVRLVIDGLYEKRKVIYEKNLDQEPENTAFVQRALKDLAILLKSPRVTMAYLALSFEHQNCSEPETRNRYKRDLKILQDTFKEELDKIHHKIHLEILHMWIIYRQGTVSLDDLKQLIQIILESSDRPVDIEGVDLRYNYREFKEYTKQFKQRATDPFDRFVPIPDTELFLSIKFSKQNVYLKKLSREEMQNL